MRTASAAALKSPASAAAPRAPRPGTRLHRLYDLLQASRGLPIQLDWRVLGYSRCEAMHVAISQLRDFYGLDLRLLHHSGTPGRWQGARTPGTWVLAGEYVGPTYRDYIAPRLAK